ncbi:MAG: hypothetical protein U0984_00835, partial [Prosthecobacter sp.]|nr:hypothetical protein [Prosthecobacter sp.]
MKANLIQRSQHDRSLFSRARQFFRRSAVGGTLFIIFGGSTLTSWAGGLTILTHGFQIGDEVERLPWLDAMTDYIYDKTGNTAAVYDLVID